MFAVLVSVLQLFAVANAFVRSLQARFLVGAAAAVLRALLIVGGTGAVLFARTIAAPGAGAPIPLPAAALGLVAAVGGPVVSFATLWLAHRRKRDAPAAQEEALGIPFRAWLPVALFDAAFVAINVLARMMSDPI